MLYSPQSNAQRGFKIALKLTLTCIFNGTELICESIESALHGILSFVLRRHQLAPIRKKLTPGKTAYEQWEDSSYHGDGALV